MEAEEVSGPGLGEAELSTSSLVLIVPPPSSSSAPRTKVYSVASLRSPRLVLTLLRSVQYSTVQYSGWCSVPGSRESGDTSLT